MHTIVQGSLRDVSLFLSLITLTRTSHNLSGLVPYRNFLWFSDFGNKAEFLRVSEALQRGFRWTSDSAWLTRPSGQHLMTRNKRQHLSICCIKRSNNWSIKKLYNTCCNAWSNKDTACPLYGAAVIPQQLTSSSVTSPPPFTYAISADGMFRASTRSGRLSILSSSYLPYNSEHSTEAVSSGGILRATLPLDVLHVLSTL